uniref:Uncharacterized protein n=1 Tax=Onchocerca volvulus TaxID=6282 RepID=A0A8R1Y5H1_ONCVO
MDAKQLLDESGAQIGERTSLLHPHDTCSVVAQQTFGTVFSLASYKVIDSEPDNDLQLLDVFI